MAPHFESAKSFADVPITDEGVDTAAFLEASDGLVQMFDLLGSRVFGFVQDDIKSNIKGTRERFEAKPGESVTIEKLVENEINEGTRVATACVIRLTRGLALTCHALEHTQRDPSLSLSTCFNKSYTEVLAPHHGMAVRWVVGIAIKAVPSREYFYECIAEGGSQEKLHAELAKWLEGLHVIVKRLSAFLEKGDGTTAYGKV